MKRRKQITILVAVVAVVAVAVASDDMHRESLPVSNAVAVALDAAVVLISTVLVPVAAAERASRARFFFERRGAFVIS